MLKDRKEIILETERLILRPLKINDAEEAYDNWCNDSEVSKYMIWTTHKNIEETKEWLKLEEKNIEEEKEKYTWGIVIKDNNKLIGSMAVYLRPEEDNRYEIGYGIAKKYWRKGYTTEAVKEMMNYLINNIGLKKFICKHAKLNPASGAVMQKAGFKYVKDSEFESIDGTKKYEIKVYYLDV